MAQTIGNQKFRIRILTLMLDKNWYGQYGISVIKQEYFETEEERLFVEMLGGFYEEYRRPPDLDEFDILLNKLENTSEEILDLLEELSTEVYDNEYDLEFAARHIIKFAQNQAIKLAVLNNMDAIQDGEGDKLVDDIRIAMDVGIGIEDIGIDLYKDALKWATAEIYEEKIPTGLFHLDMALKGGIARGEVLTFAAPPGKGKSRLLINTGLGAAGYIYGANVYHVTLELKDTKVCKRYGARTTFRWIDRNADPKIYARNFQERYKRLAKGRIIVKQYPPKFLTPLMLEGDIDRLAMKGIPIDLLVLDYADEMYRPHGGDDNYNDLGDLYRDLRSLAFRKDLAVATASQTHRIGMSKETADLDSFSDSYQKAFVADIAIMQNQTKEEREEKVVRLYGAKIRDEAGGWTILCKELVDSHAIITKKILW